MFRISTFNVNGIRAAQRRGFTGWLTERDPDVVALQEMRCPLTELPRDAFAEHHLSYHPGTIPGRNGVAVLTREAPAAVRAWGEGSLVAHLDSDHPLTVEVDHSTLARELRHFADEGRYIEVDLADRPLTVASLYLPKGGTPFDDEASLAKYQRKMRFLAGLARQLGRSRRAALAAGREFIVLGDFNVAHTRHDLKTWRTSQRSEGFLPEEREWFGSITSPRTLIDVVRRLHPDTDGPYSWWSWRGQSWTNDSGWRIDYHLATPRLAKAGVTGGTDRSASYEARISDHSPVTVDYDLWDGEPQSSTRPLVQ